MAEDPIHRRMVEQRLAVEREIRTQRDRAAVAACSFHQSLRSIRSAADETLANQEKLSMLKDHLKQLEADLGECLSVETCKEAKSTAAAESLSTSIARTEQLKKIVEDQRARKNEYAAAISQTLLCGKGENACEQGNDAVQFCTPARDELIRPVTALESLEDKSKQYLADREKIEKAILWYNKVLGFRTEGGEGVKFIFNKIDPKNLDDEYSFIIRLDGDIYTLLNCSPDVQDISNLVMDLNKSNGLFKFVRTTREKFKDTVDGLLPTINSIYPDSSSVTATSLPATSAGSSSQPLIKQNEHHLQSKLEWRNHHQKVICSQVISESPQSISALRRSPRLMVRKFT